MSPTRFASLCLLALALAGAAACDHKERRTDNPAQTAWTSAERGMVARMSGLRDRQKILSGRISALAVPEGTEDANLTQTIADLQGALGTIDGACTAADKALEQARANAAAALASPDRIAAERQVTAGANTFAASAQAAEAVMGQIEPRVVQGEQIMKRLMAIVAAEVARLQRLAAEGGSIDFSDIDFQAGSAEFDFTHATSKATLERLARFGASCPELRFSISGHTSKEGAAAANRTLSLARADAVKGYLVAQGVAAEKIVRTAGLGSTTTLIDEPDPESPAAAAMPAAQLDLIRRRNRRVNVEVVTPCPPTPSAPPSTDAPPTPPTAERVPAAAPH
ncbi:MAG: OmpA family protein [Myxococcales bacterium]|nr:OmpA family protein [Myxococcales bacterium]